MIKHLISLSVYNLTTPLKSIPNISQKSKNYCHPTGGLTNNLIRRQSDEFPLSKDECESFRSSKDLDRNEIR